MAGEIAILVLAHKAAPLEFLLASLDPRFSIFVHMDAKSPLPDFGFPDHATLIERRCEVFWGGWSMMQATLALIEAAVAAGPFRRYALVSGDSLPVQTCATLAAALLDDSVEYIDLDQVADDPSLAGMDMQQATALHGRVQPWRLHNPVAWDHRLLNPFHRTAAATYYGLDQSATDWIRGDVENLTNGLLSALRPKRPFRDFFFGSQWWALTSATLAAILPVLHDPAMQRFFRFIQVPDEHMVQTALGNRRDLRDRMICRPTPMFTDHPRRAAGTDTLDDAGFAAAAAAGMLFARKFDPAKAPGTAGKIDLRANRR